MIFQHGQRWARVCARFLAIGLFAATLGATHAADTEKDKPDTPDLYANKVAIDLGASKDGMYRLRLPIDVYRGLAHGDLRDVRVFNAKGERVPFALTREADRITEARTRTKLPMFPLTDSPAAASGTTTSTTGGVAISVKIQPDGTLISLNAPTAAAAKDDSPNVLGYIVDASALVAKNEPVRALQLDWVRNANTQSVSVRVESSNDLNAWRSLTSNAQLLDLTFNGEKLSQTRVELAATADKYLRITFGKPNVVLNSVESEAITSATQRMQESFVINGSKGEADNEYVFDTRARLTPTQLRLVLPDNNTLAPTQLFARGMVTERRAGGRVETVPGWLPVTGATFYRLTRDGAELVSPAANVSSANAFGVREWMARVDARGGGLGSGIPQLEVTWQPDDLVFVARGDAPFTLAFGRNDAPRASLNVAELIPGYQSQKEFQLPQARLNIGGSANANANANATSAAASSTIAPPTAPKPASDVKKFALWAILIIGVLLMAWMAMRLGKDEKTDSAETATDSRS